MPKRVWATRPLEQNLHWCQDLQQAGFDIVDLPLMAIEPVVDGDEFERVKQLILTFDEFEKVIFVSQNAVQEAFSWLDGFWPQLPAKIEYFAVGKKTAEKVLKHDVHVVACNSAMNTDELLALPELVNIKHQKILICRGVGGLPNMGLQLQSRGAFVHYCELYHRRLPEAAIKSSQHALNTLSSDDVIALFSGESLLNFVAVLEANECSLRNMALVVPGARVANLAESLGFTNVTVAHNASSSVMLSTICALE